MSETAAEGQTATVEKKEEAPPAFNADILQTCTARFDRDGWDLFLSLREDLDALQTTPLRATLTARTPQGAETLYNTLATEAGVVSIARQDRELTFTGTFAQIQTVIRHPETHLCIVRKY